MLPHRPQDLPPPSAGSLFPHAPLHTARAAAPSRLVGRRSPRRGGRLERQPVARERLLQARLHRGSSRTLGARSGERCLLRLLRLLRRPRPPPEPESAPRPRRRARGLRDGGVGAQRRLCAAARSLPRRASRAAADRVIRLGHPRQPLARHAPGVTRRLPPRLLLRVHRLCHRANHLERRARRLWLVGRRPLRASHQRRELPQVGRCLLVEYLVGLVVLVDGVPPAARAAAAEDLPVALERPLATPFPRPAVPRPVDSTLGAARVVRHLEQPHPRLLLPDEAAGDILHEDGKVLSEPGALLAEERRLGDAARVDGREGDAGLLCVLVVQQVGGHHQAELRVLVRLGAVKVVAVEHRDRVLGAELEAVELLQVCDRVHAAAADGVVVAGDRAHKDAPRAGRLGEVVEEEGREEEVREVVDLHLLLVPVLGPLCVRQRRLVDGGVADESVDGLGRLPLLELVDKGAHGGERVELAVHRREQVRVEAVHLGHHLHLVQVAHGADDVVLSRAQQRRRRLAAEARRGARHHDQLLAAKPRVREARLPTEGGHLQVEASRGRDRRREREEEPHAGVRP
mmetsp:Transcript_30305/g.98870  ORF Transcript_30305/g.98870 Transcript_30305/m.98870 type:complete len:572 (+) Transcript_30305:230-1945(+)